LRKAIGAPPLWEGYLIPSLMRIKASLPKRYEKRCEVKRFATVICIYDKGATATTHLLPLQSAESVAARKFSHGVPCIYTEEK
jgi:hypothetical protein